MNEQNPYEKLGVKETASFEEIQDAKKRLIETYQGDQKIVEVIEAAYDSIIMDRLRLRQEGKIKVPEGIRFAEDQISETKKQVTVVNNQATMWLQDFIDTPSQNDILQSGGVFAILLVISIFADASFLSILTSIAFAANLYFLNRKEQRFGRSVLISIVGLLLGIILGAGLAYVSNTTLTLNILTNDQISAIISFVFFWLISSFLR